MKKILLLLISFNINAVELSLSETGQVLIFPYYTVNNDYTSLLAITNTSNNAKALRLRFREAANSREVFSANLYLGAKDVWTGVIFKNAQNLTQIKSQDQSCSLPSFDANEILFTKDKFTNDFSDIYGDDDNRLYEGFIEVIEMGVLTGESEIAATIGQAIPTQDCEKLKNAWEQSSTNHYWLDDATTDLSAPTGGISGNLILINVASGIAMNQEPTVLNDFSDEIIHFNINNDSPSLADGNRTSRILNNNGNYDTKTWGLAIQAVSAVLTKNIISNDFSIEDSINSTSDIIITFPTRQYFVDSLYSGSSDFSPPFNFHIDNNMYKNCNETPFKILDREGNYSVRGIEITTPPPNYIRSDNIALCFASNSIGFKDNESIATIFGSNFLSSYLSDGLNGQAEIGLDPVGLLDQKSGRVELSFPQIAAIESTLEWEVVGLPAVSFVAQKYINGRINGKLANYAGIFKAKNSTKVNTTQQPDVQSMSLTDNGIGQVLLYPYYTVKEGLKTLLSIVNTSSKIKSLSVKFREGKNAREVMGFNLYLKPFDTWTAAIVPKDSSTIQGYLGQGSAMIQTSDDSCTVPRIQNTPQEFTPFGYINNDNYSVNNDDGQGTQIDRVLEGFIEVIITGEVTGTDANLIMHSNCSGIENHWLPNQQWDIDPTTNILPPNDTAGISGTAIIIGVDDGIEFNFAATAIKNFSSETLHEYPVLNSIGLASGNNVNTTIQTSQGFLKTAWNSPIDAVSALLMQDQTYNDYEINPSIKAHSEWIVTYPTKNYYVDPIYSNTNTAKAPFSQVLSDNKGACEPLLFTAYDREQRTDLIMPPALLSATAFLIDYEKLPNHCWSINSASIGNESGDNSIFDSLLAMQNWNPQDFDSNNNSIYDLSATSGTIQTENSNFTDSFLIGHSADGSTHTIFGKPMLGFVAQKYVNGVINGNTLANYGVTHSNGSKTKIIIEN